jgi:predicted ribosome quality control (RQC) complex YloA/Tae2 family protein
MCKNGTEAPSFTPEGLTYYIGGNARENEHITFNVGRGDDIWLHVNGVPGPHSVIKCSKEQSITEECIAYVANRLIEKTPNAHGGNAKSVVVDVCYCKDVSKPRHAKPGLVTIENGWQIKVKKM